MLHGLVEQHEVHLRDLVVVLFHLFFKNILEFVHVCDSLVVSFMTLAHSNEGRVDKRLSENLLFLEISWELLHTLPHEVQVLLMIFWENQAILPHSVALMSPHADHS